MGALPAHNACTPKGTSKVYGILGSPVAHSLSPAMQNAAFCALRLNSIYLPFPTRSQHLNEAVRGLTLSGVLGFNLTIPHKIHIMPLLNKAHPQALRIGAVNTVRCGLDDKGIVCLEGINTDATGLLKALKEDLSFVPQGSKVLLLGAGGAARAAVFALIEGGCQHLMIANRNLERAQNLQHECQQNISTSLCVTACTLTDMPVVNAPDLVLNATSVGMGDGESPLDLRQIPLPKAVMDMVYHPSKTPFLQQAQTLRIPHANGMGMLLHQGAQAFTYWTGHEAPIEVMRKTLQSSLESRAL